MRILGIDPSLTATGYGIIDFDQSGFKSLKHGVIRPSSRLSFPERITWIKNKIDEIMQSYAPDEVAIENLFYARNVKTAIILGQVRGAVIVAVTSSHCPIFEYSALEIKKAVTGYGQADKNQVKHMVVNLLHLEDGSIPDDASDALAAAFCHMNCRSFQQKINQPNKRK
jgi:crossover junction endodeoxyribonuclease RuvC